MALPTRSLLLAVLALALAACAGGSGGGDAAPASDHEVVVADFQYTPQTLEVEVGTTVTWLFDDGGVPHDVVGAGWGSQVKDDGTFTHTFDEPGTYDYVCTLHHGMGGAIVVTG